MGNMKTTIHDEIDFTKTCEICSDSSCAECGKLNQGCPD